MTDEKDSPPLTRDQAERQPTGPGDISHHESPHHSLNNPVTDPDPTEWPDPYDKREDPRDAEPGEHTPDGAESTSQPHPDQDPVAQAAREKLQRDKLDQ